MCGVPVDDHKVLGKRMNRSQGLFPRNKIGITTSIQKCNSCQLIYANPLPVVNDLADHYGVVPDSYWKSTYFEINETYFSHQIRSYQAINGKINNKNALDIGAGIGKCIIALNKAGFDTYGIEPSIPFYERALNKMNISPQNLENCTLEGFEAKNDYFDFITFGAVLEHLYDPATSIQKALTLLKPGGLIQIEVPSSSWLTNTIYNFLYKIRGLDYVGNISPMHSPFHLYEFGLESFQKNGENSGYEVVKHRYMVCSTYLPKILDPIVKPFMRMTNRGMQLEVWLKKKG
jgi:2-polyprenyl-3-methyl-5-hydroxy-6-metoxy-1,4-benzoquinol methylase